MENFHSVICRHIRGPKEQFNYGTGWREGRGKRGDQARKGSRGKLENIKFRQAAKKEFLYSYSSVKLIHVEMLNVELFFRSHHSGLSFSQYPLLLVTERQLTLTRRLVQVDVDAHVQQIFSIAPF